MTSGTHSTTRGVFTDSYPSNGYYSLHQNITSSMLHHVLACVIQTMFGGGVLYVSSPLIFESCKLMSSCEE